MRWLTVANIMTRKLESLAVVLAMQVLLLHKRQSAGETARKILKLYGLRNTITRSFAENERREH